MTEGLLMDQIRLTLGSVPGLVLWRNQCGMAERNGRPLRFGVGSPGGADLIGCWYGRFVAVEIKTETGRQTDEQVRFQRCVERNGGEYIILRSVDEALLWASTHGVREP